MCDTCKSASNAVNAHARYEASAERAYSRVSPSLATLAASVVITAEPGTDEWLDAVEDMISYFPEVPWDLPEVQYRAVASHLVLAHKIGNAFLN